MENNPAAGRALDRLPPRRDQRSDVGQFLEAPVGHGGFFEAEEAKSGGQVFSLDAGKSVAVVLHIVLAGHGRCREDMPA